MEMKSLIYSAALVRTGNKTQSFTKQRVNILINSILLLSQGGIYIPPHRALLSESKQKAVFVIFAGNLWDYNMQMW